MILFIVLLLMIIVGGLSIQRHVFPTPSQWEEQREYIWRGEEAPGNPWFWPGLLLAGPVVLLVMAGAGA